LIRLWVQEMYCCVNVCSIRLLPDQKRNPITPIRHFNPCFPAMQALCKAPLGADRIPVANGAPRSVREVRRCLGCHRPSRRCPSRATHAALHTHARCPRPLPPPHQLQRGYRRVSRPASGGGAEQQPRKGDAPSRPVVDVLPAAFRALAGVSLGFGAAALLAPGALVGLATGAAATPLDCVFARIAGGTMAISAAAEWSLAVGAQARAPLCRRGRETRTGRQQRAAASGLTGACASWHGIRRPTRHPPLTIRTKPGRGREWPARLCDLPAPPGGAAGEERAVSGGLWHGAPHGARPQRGARVRCVWRARAAQQEGPRWGAPLCFRSRHSRPAFRSSNVDVPTPPHALNRLQSSDLWSPLLWALYPPAPLASIAAAAAALSQSGATPGGLAEGLTAPPKTAAGWTYLVFFLLVGGAGASARGTSDAQLASLAAAPASRSQPGGSASDRHGTSLAAAPGSHPFVPERSGAPPLLPPPLHSVAGPLVWQLPLPCTAPTLGRRLTPRSSLPELLSPLPLAFALPSTPGPSTSPPWRPATRPRPSSPTL
jgi:hypothetical protein